MDRILFLALCCLGFFGCFQSNEFEFDTKTQMVLSSNRKGIVRLYIENIEVPNEYYKLEWVDTLSSPPVKIDLQSLNAGFKVTTGYLEKEVNNSKFSLNPNSFYLIERVQGDAASYKIMVSTNSTGLIDSIWR